MDRLQKKALRNVRMKIVSSLNPSVLVNMTCVTRINRERIKAEQRSNGDSMASSLLLDTIVTQKGWWDELLETLRGEDCEQGDIADKLEAAYAKLQPGKSQGATVSHPAASGGGDADVSAATAGLAQLQLAEPGSQGNGVAATQPSNTGSGRPQQVVDATTQSEVGPLGGREREGAVGGFTGQYDEAPQPDVSATPILSSDNEPESSTGVASASKAEGMGFANQKRNGNGLKYHAMILSQPTPDGRKLERKFRDNLERRFPKIKLRPNKTLGTLKLKDADEGIKESFIKFILISTVPCNEFEHLCTMPVEHSYKNEATKIVPVLKTGELMSAAPAWLKVYECPTVDEFEEEVVDDHIKEIIKSAFEAVDGSTGLGAGDDQPMSLAGGAVTED